MKKKLFAAVTALVLAITVFVMSASAADPCAAYKDINRSSWYHTAVDYVISNGYMTGTTSTSFVPNGTVTRAMTVQTLYAMAGKPKTAGNTPFKDLSANWYKNAVTWAYTNKIAAGMTGTTFAPNSNVTREQLATFFRQFARYEDQIIGTPANIKNYSDYNQISTYALQNMSWAVGWGLISGRSTTTLAPKATATRAELAQMLYKYKTVFAGAATQPTETTTPTETSQPSESTVPSTSPSTSASPSPSQSQTPVHTHEWEPVYKTVHHDEVGHYEDIYEEVPVYEERPYIVEQPIYETHEICNNCGEDLTILLGITKENYEQEKESGKTTSTSYESWAVGKLARHTRNCKDGKYGWKTAQVQVGTYEEVLFTETVQIGTEKKKTGTKWVVDKAAYDEQVITGYKCKTCGETKSA